MTTTSARVLGEATVQELREAVRGEIVTPRDSGYAEASQIWNGAHDGRPALVVRCSGAAERASRSLGVVLTAFDPNSASSSPAQRGDPRSRNVAKHPR